MSPGQPRMAASLASDSCHLARHCQGAQMFLLHGFVVAVAILGWGHGTGLHAGRCLNLWAKSCNLSAGPSPKVVILACDRPLCLERCVHRCVCARLCGCQAPQGPGHCFQMKRQQGRHREVQWVMMCAPKPDHLAPVPIPGRANSACFITYNTRKIILTCGFHDIITRRFLEQRLAHGSS